jgi:hypothetical protein
MTTLYKCDTCGQEFTDKDMCFIHECSHIENENERLIKIILHEGEEPCDYCEKSYYVYGCERDCECKVSCNNYNQFVPVEPLHNKSITGV